MKNLFRFRTVVNVCGDCVGCAILDTLCHEKLTEARRAVVARGSSLKRTPSAKKRSSQRILDELSEQNSISLPNGDLSAAHEA